MKAIGVLHMTSKELLAKLEEAVSVSDHHKTLATVNELLRTATEENLEVLCPFAMNPDNPTSGNAAYLKINGNRHYIVFTSPEKFGLFCQTHGQYKLSLMPTHFEDFLEEMRTRDSFGGLSINPSVDASGQVDAGYVVTLLTKISSPEHRK